MAMGTGVSERQVTAGETPRPGLQAMAENPGMDWIHGRRGTAENDRPGRTKDIVNGQITNKP